MQQGKVDKSKEQYYNRRLQLPHTRSTPFAVHYEKIRNHLRETAINYAKRHSLARKYEHLRKSQIQ